VKYEVFIKEDVGEIKKIPEGIFSEDLLLKIRHLITIIFSTDLIEHGMQIFLHIMYYGLRDGKIPAIEKGVYKTDQLIHLLDDLIEFGEKKSI